MPCSDCGHLLFVFSDAEDLRCPNCLDVELADEATVREKLERDKQLLREKNLVEFVDDYDKGHLILSLIEHLNRISYEMYNSRKLNYRDFSYLNYLIELVYPLDADTFGDEYQRRDGELDDQIEAALDAKATVHTALRHIEDEFRLCLKYPLPPTDARFLFAEYDIRDSEYRYCYHRCLKSLMAGTEDQKETFDRASLAVRDFERPSGDSINDLYDFADTFFELIIPFLFIASANDTVGDIYTTSLPPSVDVFELKDLLDRIEHQFYDDEEENLLRYDEVLAWTTPDEFNDAGEDVFGDQWEDVKDAIVVRKDNLDAHPFLFRVTIEEIIKQPAGRPPLTRERPRIVYPRHYARLLRYQIFPLLNNGENPSGHDILTEVATERGLAFEKNVAEYLDSQGFDIYYSATLPGVSSSEIDVLAVTADAEELWFIECKYLLPPLRMETDAGIEKLNAKFCHKVFNEHVEEWGDPTGRPFPEKVDEWLATEPGCEFRWQSPGTDGDQRVAQFRDAWTDIEARSLVVSNLTPSFIEREGVEFRTDVELVEMVEDEDPVYDVRY